MVKYWFFQQCQKKLTYSFYLFGALWAYFIDLSKLVPSTSFCWATNYSETFIDNSEWNTNWRISLSLSLVLSKELDIYLSRIFIYLSQILSLFIENCPMIFRIEISFLLQNYWRWLIPFIHTKKNTRTWMHR